MVTLIETLIEQLETGVLGGAISSLQEIKSHVSDESLYDPNASQNLEFEQEQMELQ